MYKQISNVEFDMLRERQSVLVLDVRDEESYDAAHIPDALHLTMEGLESFVDNADKTLPTVVYCYHGVTSQSVAQLLVEAGFDAVYSLMGGYECWESGHTKSAEK